ncbi:MAG: imidazolonepropionase [Defluviitaleaceae bacterium]|nr:imidazolonepropionase [Defluviitaleaceae bacterium]
MLDLLVKNSNLATPQGNTPKIGATQGEISIENGMNIGIKDGKIAYIGRDMPEAAQMHDAEGCLVTPGLVDSHTHLVFGGFRQHELAAKLGGADYLDILAGGGGILSTVKATRAAGFDELYAKAGGFLDDMLAHGTTTVDAKSGYGLDVETELKQLEVVSKLQKEHKADVVSTFMGAHAIPPDYKQNPDDYVDLIINEMIPNVAEKNLAEYCDIFCEKGVFDAVQSRRVLEAAKNAGFGIKMHANEINNLGGAVLAAELGAISAEHLIASNEQDLEALAKAGTIAVLLPTTSFYLGKDFAPAKKMIESGIAVAIASDFNPGSSPNFNLQLSMTLGCLKYGLVPPQVLTAVTLNAACAIGRGESKGSIEIGKDADIIIWNCPDLDFLFYRFGNNQAKNVIKNGEVII